MPSLASWPCHGLQALILPRQLSQALSGALRQVVFESPTVTSDPQGGFYRSLDSRLLVAFASTPARAILRPFLTPARKRKFCGHLRASYTWASRRVPEVSSAGMLPGA